ncbi:hypothetical protein DY000_02031635 [Brassica cretica]|uniref:Uncharacterized protein n=1 Tax=Brassica cretica TaxID=69181 RepID=A0ABQ7DIL9_BRACR|nr:hypothetical protein DY000_02031635 [Brassica cretica]
MTPKSNRKAKFPTNKRGREIEHESPSSPPPAPKKRVDMISWGQNSNTTDEIKSQTEGKICFEISVAILTLENPDEVTPPPRVTPYNPNTKPPYVRAWATRAVGEIPSSKTLRRDRALARARSLRSDGAERTLGRYVATELIATELRQRACAVVA